MIELFTNGVEVAVDVVAFVFVLVRLNRTRSKGWYMIALGWACLMFADIYWLGYQLVFGETPPYFYVAEIGWAAMYLFFAMLLVECNIQRSPSAPVPAAWVPVVIAVLLTGYFVYLRGNIVLNAIDGTLMAAIGFFAVKGLFAPPGPGFRGNRAFAGAMLFFCVSEFAMWTASCFYDSGGFGLYIACNYLMILALVLIIVSAWRSEHI